MKLIEVLDDIIEKELKPELVIENKEIFKKAKEYLQLMEKIEEEFIVENDNNEISITGDSCFGIRTTIYGRIEKRENMKELMKLKAMLEEEGIPFKYQPCNANGNQILIYAGKKRLCDAVTSDMSYGGSEGLIEIMGGLTKEEEREDMVLGYLWADEVFKRFKYCYENKTRTYKKN